MCDVQPSDGLPLEDDPRHIILADSSGTCTLILDSLSVQDSGQYICFAHSFMGRAGTLAKVAVQGKFLFHLIKPVSSDYYNFHNCLSNSPSSTQICVPTGECLSH